MCETSRTSLHTPMRTPTKTFSSHKMAASHMELAPVALHTRATPLRIVRVRPAGSAREAQEGSGALSASDSGELCVQAGHASRQFAVDKQMWGDQEQVWEQVGEPLVETVLRGYSATLMAIGPVGGGRSYTIHGTGDAPGLAPRCLRAICAAVAEDTSLHIELSMLEVHMDRVYDLLAPRDGDRPRTQLRMSSGRKGSAVWWGSGSSDAPSSAAASSSATASAAAGSSEPPSDCWHAVATFEQADALRALGEAQRTVRPTALHPRASRGHSLFFVRLSRVSGGGTDVERAFASSAAEEGAFEPDTDGNAAEWQCRLCFASVGGGERVEVNGNLSPPNLREALNLSSSLSALASALPHLCHGQASRVSWTSPLLRLLREPLEGRGACGARAAAYLRAPRSPCVAQPLQAASEKAPTCERARAPSIPACPQPPSSSSPRSRPPLRSPPRPSPLCDSSARSRRCRSRHAARARWCGQPSRRPAATSTSCTLRRRATRRRLSRPTRWRRRRLPSPRPQPRR